MSILLVDPQNLSLCPVVIETTTTTTTAPSSTTTSTTATSPTTTTLAPTTTSTTPSTTTTTSTLPPDPPDFACGACVHDRVQHRFRIENHLIFGREQVIQDRCLATEFPQPFFQVAADGTQSSVFDVTQVVEGTCQTTLTDPDPILLDDLFQPIANPDPDFDGVVVAIDRRPGYVRFNYTHPTTPPADGNKYRVVRIGIFYIDKRNPGAGERLVRVLELRVYRPPVLMVHGLWSDAGAFAAMEQTLTATNYEPYQLYRLDYRNTNDSHFSVNYPLVAGGLDAIIQQGADANLAAGKVDVVTHSMGGIISRLYVQSADYQHEVRRIVTSNTPHAGSQMASLLLDRNFDSQGLICSLLSQAISSSSVPNRGCYNGAVDDMRVTSPATTNVLNLGVHPAEIGVHAVATVFDPNDLPDLSSIPLNTATAGPVLIAQVLRACSLSLVDDIFNFDDSDLIVSATSQAGGLSGPLTSLYPDQMHMGATANPDVIARVRELLNEPEGSTSFTDAGYSPGQLGYTTPSVCPLLRRARTVGIARSGAAAGIAITGPAPGTTLTPGESFEVEVTGSADIATVVLVLSQPGGAAVVEEQSGPDATFDLQVPETALGSQNLVAAGLDAGGRLVGVSATTNVEVEVPSVLSRITVYPPVVYLRPCGTATLEVTGHYDDGVARDLSEQAGLALTFATGNAARSGGSGVVLNEPLDDMLTITFDGVDSAPVPIRVLAPDDLRLCGGEPTSSTTTVPSSTTTTSSTIPSSSSTTTTAPTPTTTTTTPETSTTTTTPDTSTTTSSTTTPPPSTTTSTLPPSCQSDTDCDDRDACTADACTPTGCQHAVVPGLEGAQCLLSGALAEPLCAADSIDRKLARFANARLERALELVRRAALATKPTRRHRLLDKARRALVKITRHKPGATDQECLEALGAQVDAILGALLEPPPPEAGKKMEAMKAAAGRR